jgi:hypothetical protein
MINNIYEISMKLFLAIRVVLAKSNAPKLPKGITLFLSLALKKKNPRNQNKN